MTHASVRHARALRSLVLVSILATLGAVALVTPANAATITVNTTADENGTGPACSLREAINSANQDQAIEGCPAGSGSDTVNVPAGIYLLTPEAGGDIEVQDNNGDETVDSITIQGAGRDATIVDGNGDETSDRVFQVFSGNATFADLTMRNGAGNRGAGIHAHTNGTVNVLRSSLHANTSSFNGGGIAATAGVTLNVTDSEISNNTAVELQEVPSGFGGGIYASDETEALYVRNSTVTDNAAYFAGGGIFIDGHDDFVGVPALIENSVVSGNSTRATGNQGQHGGGGIFLVATFEPAAHREQGAELPFSTEIVDSTIDGNTSASDGGGIRIWGCCGYVDIFESTISNNSAQNGGGIYNTAGYDFGEVNARNVTISSNYAHFQGGGIYNEGDGESSGEMYLNHVTIYRNEAQAEGGGGGIFDGTPPEPPPGTVEYRNSIIAKNSYEDCSGGGGGPISDGNNLIGDQSCDTTESDIATGEGRIDPRLEPLRDNGGPTKTHALLPGSPAIDEADGENCPDADQRGLTRPTGAQCDIGAYEVGDLPGGQPPPPQVQPQAVAKKELCRRQNPTILGTGGNDNLTGTPGADIMQGLGGHDKINGKGGDDIICGARGNDDMKGAGGDDYVKGLRGNDVHNGGSGEDKCIRGPGFDTFRNCENVSDRVETK